MKVFIVSLFVILQVSSANAKDVLFLKDGTRVSGVIIDVAPDKLTFQASKRKTGTLILTPEEVDHIKVDKIERLHWIQDNLYQKGYADAGIYHNRFGGNFCAGFFGGTIGFLIVAIDDAKIPDPQLVGEENLNNPTYLTGYNKRAKEKNMTAAGVGWVARIVVGILLWQVIASKM